MWMFVTPVLTFSIIIASFYGLAANGIKYIRWDPVLVSVDIFIMSFVNSCITSERVTLLAFLCKE